MAASDLEARADDALKALLDAVDDQVEKGCVQIWAAIPRIKE
jgi:hypothetical protein